jgi:hypothetical protein
VSDGLLIFEVNIYYSVFLLYVITSYHIHNYLEYVNFSMIAIMDVCNFCYVIHYVCVLITCKDLIHHSYTCFCVSIVRYFKFIMTNGTLKLNVGIISYSL